MSRPLYLCSLLACCAPLWNASSVRAQCAVIQDCTACPDPSGRWVIDGGTETRGGRLYCDQVEVINSAVLQVVPHDGSDKETTGNLVVVANSITVDATSQVSARGSGYATPVCSDGAGPTELAGGRGGCSVRDSGGGGAHFGRGGRGTKDCFIVSAAGTCEFPWEFEHDCNRTPVGSSCQVGGTGGGHGCWVQNGRERPIGSNLVSSCEPPPSSCNNSNCCYDPSVPIAGTSQPPTVAGQPYFHSVWETEFGASGGDKGCRDGFDGSSDIAGEGGGRIVLAAINDARSGQLRIDGHVSADGTRGCGSGNDSAGGGAGGTVLLLADGLEIGAGARVSAIGGLGGDTNAKSGPNGTDCPGWAQNAGGTCDDCGGGGGGGLVSIRSRTALVDPSASFDVAGAAGGVCSICAGEAGGGSGELQINVAYVGEQCDGFDNDLDGTIDEGLGDITCGLGPCATTVPACSAGTPSVCDPDTSQGAACQAAPLCNQPRVAVILDTSASMLQDLAGFPTFGDGSREHPGIDTNSDGQSNDSRLFLAKESLAQVISSFPEIDFSLARYHQDQAPDQSCQLASWIECAGIFASYDDPGDNTGPRVCDVPVGAASSVEVRRDSVNQEACINYAGSCGAPRRGADILAGFGTDARDVVRWVDGIESDFRDDETKGDVCSHSSGGDCEIRATGPTPLEGSLQAIQDFILPERAVDPCTACRGYTVVLVTDGSESCGGSPSAAARELFDTHGIDVHVIAVSVLAEEEAGLTALAQAGSGGTRDATFVRNPQDLVPALTAIVSGSIRFERCNGVDDDCDEQIDEGFAGLGSECDDGGIGACQGTGQVVCREDGEGTVCLIDLAGAAPEEEICNESDDDCDGRLDEGLLCSGIGECIPDDPPGEFCDGRDNNCNALVDEGDPRVDTVCESDEGECSPGRLQCIGGRLECVGFIGPREEVCNGLDDDCDGEVDNMAICPGQTACVEGTCRRPCEPDAEFPCTVGLVCESFPDLGTFCVPGACAGCGPGEVCERDVCIDVCADVECAENETCLRGTCRDCYYLGCTDGQVCLEGRCETPPCGEVSCVSGQSCFDGVCGDSCDHRECPDGQRCDAQGSCAPDPCAAAPCLAREFCNEGLCRVNPCIGLTCPVAQTCIPARGCAPDPCARVRCEQGRVCRADPLGHPQCAIAGQYEPEPRTEPARYLVTGGGGHGACALGAGTRGPTALAWLLLFSLFALALGRRR